MSGKGKAWALGAAAIGVIAITVAAGVWRWAPGVGGAPDDAGSERGAAFAVAECKPRLLDDRPALAVVFTQPLDRQQNLGELLKVVELSAGPASAEGPASADAGEGHRLQGHWTVGDNPRIAYFPYIQPQRRFRIEVPATVKSVDGVVLQAARTCEVTSQADAPSWYFASRGTVLPAGQNGGLPIVTVNQPEVDVQFLRVQPEALPRFFERVAGAARSSPRAPSGDEAHEDPDADGYDPAPRSLQGRVDGWELDQLRSSTRSVYLGRFRTSDDPSRRQVTFLPVEKIPELQEPGVYIAVLRQPGRFSDDYQVTYFYVSDIGVHVRRYARGLDAFATSLLRGTPRSGVEFELLDEHARSLGKRQGDVDGHAHFESVPQAARLLVARQGREMTVIVLGEPALDLSEFDVGGHMPAATKLFVYAGRDLYRPGERFAVSVLARDADGAPVAPAPLQAVLKRPDGLTVQTMTWRPDERLPGYFQRSLELPPDAQTGTWSLELRADPGDPHAAAVWTFQVEEFLPERMKLELRNDKPVLLRDDAFEVQVQGDYLFGAPAAGNRLLVSVSAERERHPLPRQWPGFVFGDVADDRHKQRAEVTDTQLDEQGRAEVTLPVPTEVLGSPMRVRGSFSLLESGGRPVVRSIERTVWPAPVLVGVRPLFDRDVARENAQAGFELVRVDTQGRPQPAQVTLRLVREERHYHWRYDDQKGWHSGYTESQEVVDTREVSVAARTPVAFQVGWGRYRLDAQDRQTGLTLRYRFYAGWNAQDAEEIGQRPDRVQLQLAQAPLKPGDKAQLKIVPPHDGHALVTIESDRLLWSKRIEVSTKGATLAVPLDRQWARHDLYATVTVFRPGSEGDRVTPARAVGVVHLPLDRSDRKFALSIQAPAKVLPERRTVVRIKADGLQGQQAHVTLSAVDVGILNITRYPVPDPADFFFGKHRYAADMLDMYGKLIEKMEGRVGKLAFGGDANMRDTRSLPKKVKLVDLFSGPVALDAKGEASIALDIPDFNGTLRLAAVAWTPQRYARGEAQMTVAAPVVAELATPRFVAPGDTATLALDVTNMSGATQELKVRLQAAGPLRLRDGERSVTLKDGQRTTLRFAAEPTDAYGLARLLLQVQAAGAGGLQIRRESVLQVQPAGPLERDVRRVRLEPGQSFRIDPAWLERHHRGSAHVSLTLANQPPLNVARLVQGLLDYPYGCLEQTTSAAYPHLFIDEAAAQAVGLTPRSREERARFVEGAMARLAGMQKAGGGFSLWGDGPYEAWLSAYVIGFLQDARDQGFAVPPAMYRAGQEWLLRELQQAPNRFAALPATARPNPRGEIPPREYELLRDQHRRFAELAHAAYVLARDQKAPLALVRYLHDQVRDRARSPLPLVHLALALRLMGDEARARVALDEAMQRPYGLRMASAGSDAVWAAEWLGDYGSVVRDLALSYALMHRHSLAHERRENLYFDLAARLAGRPYLSTQERLALFLAARAAGAGRGREWSAALNVGDETRRIVSRTTQMVALDPAAVVRGVSVTHRGDDPLFLEVELSGYPLKPAPARHDAIELRREWFEADGRPWTPRPLRVGEMLIVRLQARAGQRIEDGLLVDRIPAGFEVENLNLSQGPRADEFTVGGVSVAQALTDERIKHREYRDDRYVAAARLDGQWLSVFYLVRVVTPGRYVVPAPFAEDMYRPELRATGGTEAFITITDPRGGGPAAGTAAAGAGPAASVPTPPAPAASR